MTFRHYRVRDLTYGIKAAWTAQSVVDAVALSVCVYRYWKLTMNPSVSMFVCIDAEKYNSAL
jgi:hypothetical protein